MHMTSDAAPPSTAVRGRGRPRDARVDTAVSEAVAELLAEVGYDSLTIEGVAARAGVAKTTVYRRWFTKPQLVAQALDLRAHDKSVASDTGSLRGDLAAHIQAITTAMATPIGQAVIGLVPAVRHHPELAEALRNGFIATRRAEVNELLVRAESRGELRADLDRQVAIDLIVSPLWYRGLVWGESVGPDRLKSLVDILVRGITDESFE